MTVIGPSPQSPQRDAHPASRLGAETAEVDRSIRLPFLFFILSGWIWLLAASLFGYLTFWKAHNPEFLNAHAWISFGRVSPAFNAMLVYGFACNFAFGLGLWIISRLGRVPVRYPILLVVAAVFWNGGVDIGIFGILRGDLNVFDYLELPGYVAPVILAGLLFVSVWVILAFINRRTDSVYASQWYLVAGFLAFPWIFLITAAMLFVYPTAGVSQALVANWYAGSLLWLWFGSVGAALLYYLVPKLSGKPILSYDLARFGFLVLVLAGAWTGTARLAGGPFPAWIITVGIASSLLLLVFFLVTGINFLGSMASARGALSSNTALQFAFVGALSLFISGLASALLPLRSINEVVQFTIVWEARHFLLLYGFFSMVAFAGVYHALPRILQHDWPMAFMIQTHLYTAVIGLLLVVLPLALGGWNQGTALNDPSIPFVQVVRTTTVWMLGRSLGWLFLIFGHLAFSLNLVLLLVEKCKSVCCPAKEYSTTVGKGVGS